jgi:hypothetical protein
MDLDTEHQKLLIDIVCLDMTLLLTLKKKWGVGKESANLRPNSKHHGDDPMTKSK